MKVEITFFFIYLNHMELVMPTEALGMPFFPLFLSSAFLQTAVLFS